MMFKEEFKENFDPGASREDLERQNQTGKNFEDPFINTPVKVLTAKSIVGDKVENSRGEDLGNINDIMLNLRTGCIEYMVLEYGSFLGMGGKHFAIPFQQFSLDPERKVFILDRDEKSLKEAPGFDKEHWPETNSRHFEDVDSYWRRFGKANEGPII